MDVMGPDSSTYTNDHSNDSVSNETGSTNGRELNQNPQTGKVKAISNRNEGDKALDSTCYEGWREGTCIRWNGVYGFLSVMIQNPIYDSSEKIPVDPNIDSDAKGSSVEVSIRVYAHYKSLFFDPPRMQLRKGERVRILVKEADRGPRAVRVESMGSEG
jgi:hypothetical protein